MTSNMLAAIASPNTRPAMFVEATFATETIYIWSGKGSIDWNGHTWTGLAGLLSVAVAEDAATVEARGMSVTLSGLDATLLPECVNDFGLGLPVTVYFALCWTDRPYSDLLLIDSPLITWAGRMDRPEIDVSGETATITIACESRLLDMNVACDRRYTHQDAQLDHPGDLGFIFCDSIQEMTLYWGKYPVSGNNI